MIPILEIIRIYFISEILFFLKEKNLIKIGAKIQTIPSGLVKIVNKLKVQKICNSYFHQNIELR